MKSSNWLRPIQFVLLVGCLTFGLSLSASGQTTVTSTFTVSATVQATCTINPGNLSFGNISTVAASSSSTVAVQCTNGTAYNVGLNAGTATGASVTSRKMSGPGGALLNYGLFTDSGHTANWGNTTGTDTVAGTGNGNTQSLTVYGLVSAGQFVAPGNYSDTITASIMY